MHTKTGEQLLLKQQPGRGSVNAVDMGMAGGWGNEGLGGKVGTGR